jgi:hypothetical protein
VYVVVECNFTDDACAISHLRLRNEGGSWSDWLPAAGFVVWALPEGNGLKTVDAQARDEAGNVSEVVSDSIGLDQTRPVASVTINEGAGHTGTTEVTLRITASDEGGSGLSRMRVKQTTVANWDEEWSAVSDSVKWELRPTEGSRSVDVQVRDAAGNVSEIARDTIVLDRTPPVLDGIALGGGWPYVLPGEPLRLTVTAHEGVGGAGAEAIRTTTDGGTTYSEWLPFTSGEPVAIPRPGEAGPLTVRVMVRDVVGNKSKLSAGVETFLVETAPPWLGSSGSFGGWLPDRRDVDAVAFDLIRGDVLSIKLKASASPDRKALFPLVADLARPTGERLATGIGTGGLPAFLAPETGRYFVVLREEGEGWETGVYALSVAVKPPAANAKWKGVAAGGEITFDAPAGAALKASLKGADLDPGSVVVTGPGGAAVATVTGKPGSAKVAAVLGETGTWRIQFFSSGPVTASWSLKRPKGAALAEE